MSVETIHGYTLKEWSLVILLIGLAFCFAFVGVGFVIAIANNPNITITGEIDLSQWTAVVLGIAITATVLVSQQLGNKNLIAAIRDNDRSWIESENPPKPGSTTN